MDLPRETNISGGRHGTLSKQKSADNGYARPSYYIKEHEASPASIGLARLFRGDSPPNTSNFIWLGRWNPSHHGMSAIGKYMLIDSRSSS